ncbi:hypothetical protein AB1Y20_015920 [Prymnesium parvum]|uniref:Uncharacterized protein n=1 Tax=Prymnesium parvum TaxID=97485 RepID=A0AB34K4B9_PRYPA
MPSLRPLLWLLLAPRADGLAALPRAALARPSPPCAQPRSLSLPLPMEWHTRSAAPHMIVRRAAATVIPAFQFARPMKGALVILFLVSAIIAWKRSPKAEVSTETEITIDEEEPVPETTEADSSPSIPASSLWVDQALEKVRALRDAPPVPPPPKPSVAWSAPPSAPKPNMPPPPPPTLVSPPAQSIPAPPTAPTLEETPVRDPPAPPVPEASAMEEVAAAAEMMEPPPAPSPVASPPPPPKEAIAPAPAPPPISPPISPPVLDPPTDVTANEKQPKVSAPPTPAPSPDPLPKSSATPVVSSAPPARESRPLPPPPSVPSPSAPAVSARKPMAAGLMRRLKEGVY